MKIDTEAMFEAAHRLSFYKGKCNRLHGHNWKVELDIESSMYSKTDNMVMDFTKLKKILDEFDHKILIMDSKDNRTIMKSIPDDWICWLSFEPTAENLAKDISETIASLISMIQDGSKIVTVKVWESDHAYAEAIA